MTGQLPWLKLFFVVQYIFGFFVEWFFVLLIPLRRSNQGARPKFEIRVHTEWQLVTLWRTFHHDGKISPAWWGWGAHARPPFHYIYLHVQSSNVRSSREGRYTSPIFTLPLYILCGSNRGPPCGRQACMLGTPPSWISDATPLNYS